MHDDREVLKTGQLAPLRKMEDVTKDYNKVSQEVSYLSYMKHLAENEVKDKNDKIHLALKKMEDLNKEGAIIKKYEGEKNGQETN